MIWFFCAGAAYAAGLWFIATRVARQRGIALAAMPVWLTPLGGLIAAASATGMTTTAALGAASLIGAIVCAVVDARTGFIFDALCLTMALVAAPAACVAGQLVDGVIAAAAVGGGLLILYGATHRRGIGLGDVKLGAALALGYGSLAALIAIGAAFVLGAIYGCALVGLGRAKPSDAVRFGPFIAGGAALSLGARAAGWPW